jgi:hypothetical protein
MLYHNLGSTHVCWIFIYLYFWRMLVEKIIPNFKFFSLTTILFLWENYSSTNFNIFTNNIISVKVAKVLHTGWDDADAKVGDPHL